MISINYNFNYYNTLKVTFVFLLFSLILKSLFKTPSVIFEFALLSLLLVFSLIYAAQYLKINRISSGIFLLFLIYILLHTLSAIFLRPFIYDIPFDLALQFSLLEFRVSTISYFLSLVFIPLMKINHEKFENFIFIIIKISIIYTIAEQILSLIGMRGFFETFYTSVSSIQIGAKSLGLYRVWGVVGSPQLLGVFHLFTLMYMLHRNNNTWAFLSIVTVILSTSKTAYLLLLVVGFLYLLYNKKYLLLFILSIFTTFLLIFIFNIYFNIIENMTDDKYPRFQKFIGSIIGYVTLLFNVREESAPEIFIPGGALYTLFDYYSENYLQIFLGKGLTYSFMQDNLISNSDMGDFLYLTSDFYILTFFDQYGIFGTILLIYVFGIYPLYRLLSGGDYLYFIPIIFLLSMLHYPPHIPKLMMLLTSYPLFKIYLYDKK